MVKKVMVDIDNTIYPFTYNLSLLLGDKKLANPDNYIFKNIPFEKIRTVWDKQIKTEIKQNVKSFLYCLNQYCKITFVTYRPKNYFSKTFIWLLENVNFSFDLKILNPYERVEYLKKMKYCALIDDNPFTIDYSIKNKINIFSTKFRYNENYNIPKINNNPEFNKYEYLEVLKKIKDLK